MTTRSLFAVVFEVRPNPAHKDDYLQIAAGLRARLLDVPGFLENERFRSRHRNGYLLSLSLWDNEKALVQWRTMAQHHAAQVRGRQDVLDDYRIRVGEVTQATGSYANRTMGWVRQDSTETGAAKAITLIDGVMSPNSTLSEWIGRAHPSAVDGDVFDHIETAGRTAVLMSWRTEQEASDFAHEALSRDPAISTYTIRVVRDYSLTDRREAPQYYPPR